MVALLKTSQIQESLSSTVNLTLDGSGGVAIGQNASVAGTLAVTGATTLTGGLTAGTASVAPIKFTSGVNLTSATAGALEYDGKVIYGTPQGSQRGVIPGSQFFRLDTNLAGANVNTAQSIFGVGVTLSSNTVYEFECHYVIAKTAGTTDHSINNGYGGTATINNILYSVISVSDTTALPISTNAPYGAAINTATASKVTTSTTNSTMTRSFTIRGAVSINAGGTFIPQYTCTAAPGGAYSTVAGSYFLIYPVGASGSNTSVGTWA